MLAHGLAASSLRPLAAAAGTSDRMLLYYFDDKSSLIAAILQHVAERLSYQLDIAASAGRRPRGALVAELFALMTSPAFWPSICVWLETAALAARGDPVCAAVGDAIGRGFLVWGRERLECPEAERDAEAARLLVTVEGMVLLHALGLGDVSRAAI